MSEVARTVLTSFLRQVAVAVVTALVIVALLALVFRGQSIEERELQAALVQLQEQTLEATLAEVCVLSLPVSVDAGRDATDVRECFTQYGFEPPQIVDGD